MFEATFIIQAIIFFTVGLSSVLLPTVAAIVRRVMGATSDATHATAIESRLAQRGAAAAV